MLAGRFVNQDRIWPQFVAVAAGKKDERPSDVKRPPKRTGTGGGSLSVMDHDNKDGRLAQFILQRHFYVLTGLDRSCL
jgi:hypothetical protein